MTYKRMRILYIVNSTDMSGGATKSFLTLLNGVKNKGVVPWVITPDRNGLYKVLCEQNYAVQSLNYRMAVYPDLLSAKDYILFIPRILCRKWLEYQATRRIIHICQKESIQLIHTNVCLVSCGYKAAQKLNIPHFLHFREYVDTDFGYHHYPSKKRFYKDIAKKASYYICITRGVMAHHRLEEQRSRVIYNGITTESAQKHDSEFANLRYFLFAGRIELAKDPFSVVQAYHRFLKESPETKTVLLLAGAISDKKYMEQIDAYIRKNGIEDKVKYIGVRKDIPNIMQTALATIVPSLFEAFGRILPEAMLNNCLTIGRDTAGTKEQYDNGLQECGSEIGLRFHDVEELTNIMLQVDRVPAHFYDSMKSKAKDTVIKLYNENTYIDKVYSFYKETLSKNSTLY